MLFVHATDLGGINTAHYPL